MTVDMKEAARRIERAGETLQRVREAVGRAVVRQRQMGDRLLVGVVKSGVEYGQKAAGYALEILQGTPVGNLPITRAATGSKMINGVTARRLGISFEDDRAEGVRLVGG